METNFDDIRSYRNEEVHDALMRLSEEKPFMKILSTIYPFMPKENLKERLAGFHTSVITSYSIHYTKLYEI